MRQIARRVGGGLLAAVGLLAAMWTGAWWWFLHWQPDRERFPVRGIDVSHHQGVIDWQQVARNDVAFAYLKATEGGDHRDRRFAYNWQAARAAGLKVGAYHFFTFCRSGEAQARNFLAAVPHAADALAPAVDLEFGGNCGARPDGGRLRAQLDAFLSRVETDYGQPVLLYVTPEFQRAYRDYLPARALWQRSIMRVPDDTAPWTIWQFHNRGRIAGIRGAVDLNVFRGDRASFARVPPPRERPQSALHTGESGQE